MQGIHSNDDYIQQRRHHVRICKLTLLMFFHYGCLHDPSALTCIVSSCIPVVLPTLLSDESMPWNAVGVRTSLDGAIWDSPIRGAGWQCTNGLLWHRKLAETVHRAAEEIEAIPDGQGCASGEWFEETITCESALSVREI